MYDSMQVKINAGWAICSLVTQATSLSVFWMLLCILLIRCAAALHQGARVMSGLLMQHQKYFCGSSNIPVTLALFTMLGSSNSLLDKSFSTETFEYGSQKLLDHAHSCAWRWLSISESVHNQPKQNRTCCTETGLQTWRHTQSYLFKTVVMKQMRLVFSVLARRRLWPVLCISESSGCFLIC